MVLLACSGGADDGDGSSSQATTTTSQSGTTTASGSNAGGAAPGTGGASAGGASAGGAPGSGGAGGSASGAGDAYADVDVMIKVTDKNGTPHETTLQKKLTLADGGKSLSFEKQQGAPSWVTLAVTAPFGDLEYLQAVVNFSSDLKGVQDIATAPLKLSPKQGVLVAANYDKASPPAASVFASSGVADMKSGTLTIDSFDEATGLFKVSFDYSVSWMGVTSEAKGSIVGKARDCTNPAACL